MPIYSFPETVEIRAEDLDKLWENKPLKEKRKKMEKELKELEAKYEKVYNLNEGNATSN